MELKVYACYWEGFLIIAVIQIWSADLEREELQASGIDYESGTDGIGPWLTFSPLS